MSALYAVPLSATRSNGCYLAVLGFHQFQHHRCEFRNRSGSPGYGPCMHMAEATGPKDHRS